MTDSSKFLAQADFVFNLVLTYANNRVG